MSEGSSGKGTPRNQRQGGPKWYEVKIARKRAKEASREVRITKVRKPNASEKPGNKQKANARKKHEAREDQAESLGRAQAGNRLDTSEGWC